jgi:hypothetical protein
VPAMEESTAHGTPAATETPIRSLIHQGTRVDAKHLVGPALYWAPDGDETTATAARLRLRAEIALQQQTGGDNLAETTAKPKVRAIRSFSDLPNLPVAEGDLYDVDAEVVRRVPEAFVPA